MHVSSREATKSAAKFSLHFLQQLKGSQDFSGSLVLCRCDKA